MIERLFASEEAAAIERMLDDVADLGEAATAFESLRETLSVAFVSGEERAWRRVYVLVALAVAQSPFSARPARARLCEFLIENADLAAVPDADLATMDRLPKV